MRSQALTLVLRKWRNDNSLLIIGLQSHHFRKPQAILHTHHHPKRRVRKPAELRREADGRQKNLKKFCIQQKVAYICTRKTGLAPRGAVGERAPFIRNCGNSSVGRAQPCPKRVNTPTLARRAKPRAAQQVKCGNSSVGRAQPCQGWGREFESRFPLKVQKF